MRFREQARRLPRVAGPVYGLTYGLACGLTTWGYDTWVLARSSAELAWAKLEVGLPLLILITAATGTLAGRSERADAWVGAWMVGGALIGIVVAATPFVGYNLATWIAEPHLWGVNTHPIGPAGTTRLIFVAAVTGCAGAAVGLVGRLLIERARARAASTGRMSGRPWAALALCLPLALPPGLIGDELINRPLRIGQQTVHEAISIGPPGDVSHIDAGAHRDLFSDSYTLHLVGYDLERQEQETIDVAFDNGYVVRCQISGQALAGCTPISPQFEAWMEALIQEGLEGGRGTELPPHAGHVSVGENVLSWLASQRAYMGKRYDISRDTQRGGWVVMSARFDTGYVLTCYFHGASPVVVERCSGG
jgi:hypothetical protein